MSCQVLVSTNLLRLILSLPDGGWETLSRVDFPYSSIPQGKEFVSECFLIISRTGLRGVPSTRFNFYSITTYWWGSSLSRPSEARWALRFLCLLMTTDEELSCQSNCSTEQWSEKTHWQHNFAYSKFRVTTLSSRRYGIWCFSLCSKICQGCHHPQCSSRYSQEE